MPESDFQTQCNQYLEARGILYFHLQKGRANAQRRIQVGGLPDFLIWHKGRHCVIELKTDTGTLNTKQKDFFEKLDNAGFPVQVVRTMDEFITAIDVFIKT